MKKTIVHILLYSFLFSFFWHTEKAQAFECLDVDTVEQSVQYSSFVFRGVLKEKKNTEFIFEVVEFWKGVTVKNVVAYNLSGKEFGDKFNKGEEYLIFIETKNEIPYINPCGKTKKYTEAEEIVKELGEARGMNAELKEKLDDKIKNEKLKETAKKYSPVIVILVLLATGVFFLYHRFKK